MAIKVVNDKALVRLFAKIASGTAQSSADKWGGTWYGSLMNMTGASWQLIWYAFPGVSMLTE